jgi:hypothetical protein
MGIKLNVYLLWWKGGVTKIMWLVVVAAIVRV